MQTIQNYVSLVAPLVQGEQTQSEKCQIVYGELSKTLDFSKKEDKALAYKVANQAIGIGELNHNATAWKAMRVYLGIIPAPKKGKKKASKKAEPKPKPVPKVTPKTEPKPKTGEIFHKNFEDMVAICSTRGEHSQSLYLYGPAGTGKSHVVEQLAARLGLDYSVMNSCTDVYDLKGFRNANGEFMETDFFRCFTKGGVFCLDEMDNSVAQALTCINGALANHKLMFGDGEVHYEHKDFIFVGCGNTTGRGGNSEYVRQVLDQSTLDRFAFIETEYDKRIELHLAKGASAPEQLVDFIDSMRCAAKEFNINLLITYRAIKSIVSMEKTLGIEKSVNYGINKGLSAEDLRYLGENCKCSFTENKYLKAFKKLY